MRKVIIYSLLLIAGIVFSQILNIAGSFLLNVVTMIALSYIMIEVGYEFEIDKTKPMQYLWDYIVAFTAAAFPWIFVTLYFVFFMTDSWTSFENWRQSAFLGRFAAPTSAGILLSMLAAAGLGLTWVYKKVRILVIFDDIDTILLLIPLKIIMIGFKWQLFVVIIPLVFLLWLSWKYLHRLRLPSTWPWLLAYSLIITVISEAIYYSTMQIDENIPIQIEVLLPAFVLGSMLRHSPEMDEQVESMAARLNHYDSDEIASTAISGCFMVLVGLSLPSLQIKNIEGLSWGMLVAHVVFITLLSNIGKMFPIFCYRKEASLRRRLAVCISMFPRGEVGAGILVISMRYGISDSLIIAAVLSLTVNLLATGLFIIIVTRLLKNMN